MLADFYCRNLHVHKVFLVKTRSSGKSYFVYFPYISHLFDVLEPNLMEINLSEPTLTSFNPI
jgi:hypothetical protein